MGTSGSMTMSRRSLSISLLPSLPPSLSSFSRSSFSRISRAAAAQLATPPCVCCAAPCERPNRMSSGGRGRGLSSGRLSRWRVSECGAAKGSSTPLASSESIAGLARTGPLSLSTRRASLSSRRDATSSSNNICLLSSRSPSASPAPLALAAAAAAAAGCGSSFSSFLSSFSRPLHQGGGSCGPCGGASSLAISLAALMSISPQRPPPPPPPPMTRRCRAVSWSLRLAKKRRRPSSLLRSSWSWSPGASLAKASSIFSSVSAAAAARDAGGEGPLRLICSGRRKPSSLGKSRMKRLSSAGALWRGRSSLSSLLLSLRPSWPLSFSKGSSSITISSAASPPRPSPPPPAPPPAEAAAAAAAAAEPAAAAPDLLCGASVPNPSHSGVFASSKSSSSSMSSDRSRPLQRPMPPDRPPPPPRPRPPPPPQPSAPLSPHPCRAHVGHGG
mmetsp:Transcript_17227/g.48918  ORF Transcript_17227/g.48918 Transcript_17227/m.48918 type:complete len:444 (-) Transcript_17227:914-2245(-)